MASVSPAALVEMKQGLDDITGKLRPLIEEVRAGNLLTTSGISYLEVKHLLLFSYCETLVFYVLCKSEGRNIKDHPLWQRLAEIKFLLEKVRTAFAMPIIEIERANLVHEVHHFLCYYFAARVFRV